MADYKSMYLKLFNAVTDTINALQTAQSETEDMYMNDKSALSLLTPKEDENGDTSKWCTK